MLLVATILANALFANRKYYFLIDSGPYLGLAVSEHNTLLAHLLSGFRT